MTSSIRPGGETPNDLLQIDSLLTDEERLIRDTVREFVGDKVLPDVAEWFEAQLPDEWTDEPPEISVDNDEILVVIRIGDVELCRRDWQHRGATAMQNPRPISR